MATPTSIRLSDALERRVRARAYLDRTSFSDTLRRLVECGLDARAVGGAGVDEGRSLAGGSFR